MSNIFDRMASGDESHNNIQEEMLLESDEHLGAEWHNAEGTVPLGTELDRKTPDDIKRAFNYIWKNGFIEEENRPDLFQSIRIHETAIQQALEPLDLEVRLDTHRGVAYLGVAKQVVADPSGEEGWSHPLVRRQRLTLEQSLIIAILRQTFVIHEQESGVGHSPAKIAIDELLPQFLVYFGDTGSDSKNESRLLQLLDQLKGYGLVSEVDKKQEVTIRPLIAHLANPESLQALLQVMREQRNRPDDGGQETP